MRFQGKTVLITGGTSGIGLATARQLGREGAFVVIAGRQEQKGKTALANLKQQGIESVYLPCDVSRQKDCRNLIDQVMLERQQLDILINSAGQYWEGPFQNLTEAELDRMIDVNLKGTLLMCQAAFIQMKKQGQGIIVNVSSDAGLRGNAGCTAYCAAKGGVSIFTQAFAVEAIQFGVRVNCVCPGDVETPLVEQQVLDSPDPESFRQALLEPYPIGRLGQAEEVAKVIAFLSSAEASFMVGALVPVDGGLTAC